jgi:Bacteriophage Sf6, terminase small subunit-like
MPRRGTVFQWLAKYPEFARLYAEAQDDQIEGLAGDATEIARNEPDLARARLMDNTCFARIGKIRPRKYR